MGTFSIRVVDEDGRPRRSVKIMVGYGAMGGVGTEYTDDDGWTTWEIHDHVSFKVYIDGGDGISRSFTDGDAVSFTVPAS